MLQAVWTRFFPTSVEIRRLLAQDEVGEVKVVRAEFGVPLMHVPRSVQKELGGGAVLELGIYCLQLISMVYNGEKPECIQAKGVCLETGNLKQTTEISRLLFTDLDLHLFFSSSFANRCEIVSWSL